MKRGSLAIAQPLFYSTNGTVSATFGFTPSDQLYFSSPTTSQSTPIYIKTTTAVFRDPAAWYHVVLNINTDNLSTSSRISIYVNGQLQACTILNGDFPQSQDPVFSGSFQHRIGSTGTDFFNGYLAEIQFIDGQSLDASSFGQTDAITGQWIPKRYSGTYGNNGYYLDFLDHSTTAALGTDASGRSNHWSCDNLQVQDQVIDSPTNNFCVLNPLDRYGSGLNSTALAMGNLKVSLPGGTSGAMRATFGLTNGKWYAEFTVTTAMAGPGFGSIGADRASEDLQGGLGNSIAGWAYRSDGSKQTNNVNSGYGSAWSSDTIGILLDLDAGTVKFSKNGAVQADAFTGINGTDGPVFPVIGWTGASGSGLIGFINFGQGGQGGLSYDSASGGRFKYTPPTGFRALCAANLSVPTIKNPSQHFNAVTYTGTGGAQTISTLSFQPDLVWAKARNSAQSHVLTDAARGNTSVMLSNSTNGDSTWADGITSFTSNGFGLGVNAPGGLNSSALAYVAWCWKAGTIRTGTTQGSGSLQSFSETCNNTAGFSVVTYTGNGTLGHRIPHNLGTTPSMIFTKQRGPNASSWAVWHTSLNASSYLYLDSSAGQVGSWSWITPASTHFQVETSGANWSTLNQNGCAFIAYLWAEVSGFSRFGSYMSNSTVAPFVYCGFKPRYVLIKCIDTASTNWMIYDSVRDKMNPVVDYLAANLSNAENTNSPAYDIDFLSNGFKLRSNGLGVNGSTGNTHIFAAFAEAPFKYARAR